MEDRRQIPRWQINKAASVFFEGAASASHGLVENINLKGLCLALEEKLPQDRPARMALTIDDNLYIDIEAGIPWVRAQDGHYVHGMCFTRIMDADRENIYKYVNDHFPHLLRSGWWDEPPPNCSGVRAR